VKTVVKEASRCGESSGRMAMGLSSVGSPEKSVQLLMLPPGRTQKLHKSSLGRATK
jgi:hypothetical protein